MEWRETSRGVLGAHHLEPNERQGAGPALLSALDVKAEGLDDRLVRPLARAVCLWVVSSGKLGLNARQTQQCLLELRNGVYRGPKQSPAGGRSRNTIRGRRWR